MRATARVLPGVLWALSLASVMLAAPGVTAQAAAPQIRFTYENPKLQPRKYVVTVQENGDGHFFSETGPAMPGDPAMTVAGAQDRPIHISKSLREEMFTTARKNKLFAFSCDAHEKNIAFQGTKTLEYEGSDGQGSCQYNWSKSAAINKLTDQLQAVAATIDEGSKLERQYEHGRLSLDTELELLTQMVQQGRAGEIENIAPILQKLAGDEAVLQRVQRRARALLDQANKDGSSH